MIHKGLRLYAALYHSISIPLCFPTIRLSTAEAGSENHSNFVLQWIEQHCEFHGKTHIELFVQLSLMCAYIEALTHVYKNLFPSVGQSVCQVTLSLNQQNSLYFCHNLCSFRERASDKGSGSINQSINHSFNHYVYSWMVCLKFMRSGKLLEYSFK